jgi:nicotinate-nucleotide--dimethylbenzimidazole phosphoribosyltransferase
VNNNYDWLNVPSAQPDETSKQAAIRRQASLTKPPGSLGELEVAITRLAALQGTERPSLERISITIFAADHGVAAEGVSAFPQEVTAEMVKNFAHGGAAISVLARALGAELEVINLGTVHDPGALPRVLDLQLGSGTANFCQGPAMHEEQLSHAIHAGRHSAERAKLSGTQLFIGGEMGIGNTTAATALACNLLNLSPELLVGPGSGLDSQGIEHKIAVIQRALARHGHLQDAPLEALRCLGGFEIAGLTGSYLACAHMGIPILVDGFICTVAALIATRLCPDAAEWMLFSHTSAEPGHQYILQALQAKPLLNIGMRLGEGSGAASCVPLLRLACTLHNEMSTFAEANVTQKIKP